MDTNASKYAAVAVLQQVELGALVSIHTDMEEKTPTIDNRPAPIQCEGGLLVHNGPSFPRRLHLPVFLGAREARTFVSKPMEPEQVLVPVEPQAPTCEEEASAPTYDLLDRKAITKTRFNPKPRVRKTVLSGRGFLSPQISRLRMFVPLCLATW